MVKKVCHLLITYGNKNQDYTSDLISSLNSISTDDHFVFCHHAYTNTNEINVVVSHQINWVELFLSFFSLYFSNQSFRTLCKKVHYSELKKWIWLIRYDIKILHVHHEHAIPIEVLSFFKAQKIKIIMTLRGRDLLLNTTNRDKSDALQSKLLLADEVHCISNHIQEKLYALYHIKGVVIYRGQPLPDAIEVREQINDKKEITIICVGRLVWEKGHMYLIESVNRLKLLGYHIKVDIFGDGNLKEFLNYRIKQLQLDNEIHLRGFLKNEELKSKYKNYDMAVQPSLSEALSNGLIDMMLHDLPCVITNVGGMVEVIQHGKNGIVFDKNDMTLMDNAILQARALQIEEVKAYNNGIKVKFSSEKEVQNLLNIYG